MDDAFLDINRRVVNCRRCPRLVAWREEVAELRVRRYRDQPYWGRPVPGFGDPTARLLIVGLAPGAHGANRTGRMFTGDSSGQWLIRALFAHGFANQPTSESRHDGLELIDAYMTAAVRCVPPDNRPTRSEIMQCTPYLEEEFRLLGPRVIVALGRVAYDAVRRTLKAQGVDCSGWVFGHGSQWECAHLTLIASYHPSRQNTQTGKLTSAMLSQIFAQAQAAVWR